MTLCLEQSKYFGAHVWVLRVEQYTRILTAHNIS